MLSLSSVIYAQQQIQALSSGMETRLAGSHPRWSEIRKMAQRWGAASVSLSLCSDRRPGFCRAGLSRPCRSSRMESIAIATAALCGFAVVPQCVTFLRIKNVCCKMSALCFRVGRAPLCLSARLPQVLTYRAQSLQYIVVNDSLGSIAIQDIHLLDPTMR